MVQAECYLAVGNERLSVSLSYRPRGRRRETQRKLWVFSSNKDAHETHSDVVAALSRQGWIFFCPTEISHCVVISALKADWPLSGAQLTALIDGIVWAYSPDDTNSEEWIPM